MEKIAEHLLSTACANFRSHDFKYSQRPRDQSTSLGERNTVAQLFCFLPDLFPSGRLPGVLTALPHTHHVLLAFDHTLFTLQYPVRF